MAQCMTPFSVRVKLRNETVAVPCGKCPACVARRVSAWSFRLMMEDRYSHCSYFITLTYSTENLRLSKSGLLTVSKRDVQLFMKRLRKANRGRSLKYYAVGEYGGRFKRPHYHLLLYNCDLGTIQSAWGLGHVHYGFVSGASVGYTLKYMSKKGRIGYREGDDRQRQFALMSKGIGLRYVSDEIRKWHHDDLLNRMYCVLKDGKKVSMPRYYKDKLYSDMERKRIAWWAAKRIVEEQEKARVKGGEMYEYDKFVRIEAAFRRMEVSADADEGIVNF